MRLGRFGTILARKLISVVVPAYNEEACLRELCRRLVEVFAREQEYDFEVVLVDNGSTDQTWTILRDLNQADSRLKSLQLSRNFGADGGITAGMHHISGDACVILMADLQEPPELIHTMLRKWEEGFENIYGLVVRRQGISAIRRMNSQLFYWAAGKLTGNSVVPNASDFRLVDRKVYQAVLSMEEKNQFIRGLFSWVGFSSIGVPFERSQRFGGYSKAHTVTVVKLAVRGILSHSFVPLRLITFLGVLASFTAIGVLTWFTFLFLTAGVPFDGFGTLVGLNLLGFAVLALSLGVLGEYLALTYEETKNRPLFVVRELQGFD